MAVLRPVTQVFVSCRERLMATRGGMEEIDHVNAIIKAGPEAITPWFFFKQYSYVVLCSYWKEQYARKEWEAFFESGGKTRISNTRKREAIWAVRKNYEDWFEGLLVSKDRLAYLDTMPMIGPVTCRHLARNIGIDCVKPDRHMCRLAAGFGYGSSNKVEEQACITTQMCEDIRKESGEDYLGTIDVILWRACNLGWL